ncbi:MAG: hypothetical protein AAF492_26260, partial [Verrucomicrobiota bacterium]
MRRNVIRTGYFILLLALLAPVSAQEADRRKGGFQLNEGDTVMFAGGANMVRLNRTGYLETMLTHAFAQARPKFRDLSWEADTVFAQGTVLERWRPVGFGQRDEQFKRIGATVVIAQFGQLESMAGPEKLDDFVKAYHHLIDGYLKQAREVVLISPVPFETPKNALIPDLTQHNVSLAVYVKAMADIAADRKLKFVDLFTEGRGGLTENGMHVLPEAQTRVAREVARQLRVKAPAEGELEALRVAVIEKHRLWYDYWRPANWKLLYGDDSRREFTRGGRDYMPFREEWQKLIPLIETA